MIVNEIYKAIQGEGPEAGKPVIFVRLWGCNLQCAWAGYGCDTPYSWDRKRSEESDIKRMTIEEVAKEIIKEDGKTPCYHIVFTGGEPMIQQEVIGELMNLAELEAYIYDFETNGTIKPDGVANESANLFVVSPKLSSSMGERKFNTPARRIKPEALARFAELSQRGRAAFKFVIASFQDCKEMESLIEKYNMRNVWLMPEGTDAETITKNSQMVMNYCRQHGYNFTSRLHILAYGMKRKV